MPTARIRRPSSLELFALETLADLGAELGTDDAPIRRKVRTMSTAWLRSPGGRWREGHSRHHLHQREPTTIAAGTFEQIDHRRDDQEAAARC